MKKKLNKQEGIVFWITGLSGSGKSTIAKKIFPMIKKNYGTTLLIHGDDIRKIFYLSGYSKKERLKIGKKYINLLKLITKQKVNVIFSVIGLFRQLRKENRKCFKNYIEIFIKASIKDIKNKNKKKIIYNRNKNIWGVDIKPEYPNDPDIAIKNNFIDSPTLLSEKIIEKIKKII